MGRRSGAADGQAGGTGQVVMTGEGATTGARREARGEGREGCPQRAPKGLEREVDGRPCMEMDERGGKGHARWKDELGCGSDGNRRLVSSEPSKNVPPWGDYLLGGWESVSAALEGPGETECTSSWGAVGVRSERRSCASSTLSPPLQTDEGVKRSHGR